ncbi:hypothetical protein [Rhodohalobacter sp. 614A]|uniref:hypothetical protein n=1 Tax=Rhodohalobacter sp. 614A TaxID=2908649 RepID=UPI001F22401C|nr:hypothetical protein [Rhodohalobacter sp. 614A]
MNKSTSEVLDFLVAVINKIEPYCVSLLELRTDGSAVKTSPSDWISFQNILQRSTTLQQLKVPELNENDGIEFVEYWLPGLGSKRAKVILKRIGMNPFLIETTCHWLKNRKIVTLSSGTYTSISNLEVFFEGITPEKAITVVRSHIDFWVHHKNAAYRYVILAAGLLKGELPLGFLGHITSTQNGNILADKLLQTGLFVKNFSTFPSLRIRHDLLKECISTVSDDNPFLTAEISNKLKKLVLDFSYEDLHKQNLVASLSLTAGDLEEAFDQASHCADEYLKEGQMSLASEMWEVAYNAAELYQNEIVDREKHICHSLLGLLKVEELRNRIQLDRNKGKLAALETHITLTPELIENESLKAKFLLLKWKRYFLLEQFQEANDIAELLERLITKTDKKIQASIWSSLALTKKGLGKKEHAQAVYDKAVKKIPENLELKVQRYSNLAANYLGSNPERSLSFYKKIRILLENDAEASLLTMLHVKVDIAMAHFLIKKYTDATVHAENAVANSLSNGFETQEARARNILACCYWVDKKISAAANQIELATFTAEKSFYFRFLWRMKTNAAAIFAELNKKDVTIQNALDAYHLITEPRKNRFDNESLYRQRWYAGLLSILCSLDLVDERELADELVAKTQIIQLRKDLQYLRNKKWPKKFLSETSHVHGNKIMVTG